MVMEDFSDEGSWVIYGKFLYHVNLKILHMKSLFKIIRRMQNSVYLKKSSVNLFGFSELNG